jgi:hypothetical protein
MAGRGRAGPAAFSTSRSRTRVGGAQRCFLHAGIKAGRKFLDGWSFDHYLDTYWKPPTDTAPAEPSDAA